MIRFIVLLVLLPFSISYYAQYFGFDRVDSIHVIENNLSLDFPWVGGLNSVQFSTIHLNNDSFEDLFVFDRTGNKILTFINNGTSYQYAPEYETMFPELKSWVLLRDYNCDGKKDIFSYVSGGIGLWKNTSSGNGLSFVKVTSPYIESHQYNSVTNLFVSKVDVPDINDIDGDGDLDVLTFGVLGSRLEYHKNLRAELGYDCDSVIYELKNSCWGHFTETGANTNVCNLFDTCSTASNVPNPEKEQLKHTGSTILSLDLNNDGVRDILLGDVSFNNIIALYNDNSGVNLNSSMVSQDSAFPTYDVPIDINIFPATFYEDVDNDGIKDLLASPDVKNNSDNQNSVWLYKNTGTNTLPIFNFVEDNFLQNKMVEYGRSAYPVLLDYNNDGLTDLFVSSFGVYDPSIPEKYVSKIALYQNTGTATQPEFTLVTDDFANLSGLGLGKALYPAFGDIDGDTDIDLFLGNYNGNIFYFENTSNDASVLIYGTIFTIVQDDSGNNIDVGAASKPTLYDLNNDGDLDLVVGEESGNLNYFENVGSSTSYTFRLQSETFGGVEVSEWWTTIGNSVPLFIEGDNNETQLLVGSKKGDVFHYHNIDNNLSGNFTPKDTIRVVNEGPAGAPALAFLNNDVYPDMIIGNERGGLSFFYGKEGTAPNAIVENEFHSNWRIYPNPAKDLFYISSSNKPHKGTLTVFNSLGEIILSHSTIPTSVSAKEWENGFYLVVIKTVSGTEVKKLLKY